MFQSDVTQERCPHYVNPIYFISTLLLCQQAFGLITIKAYNDIEHRNALVIENSQGQITVGSSSAPALPCHT